MASRTRVRRSAAPAAYTGSAPRSTSRRLPVGLGSSAWRTETGTSAKSSRPSGRTPREGSQRRSAPVTTAMSTSLTVPPSVSLMSFTSSSGASVQCTRRCGPMGRLSGVSGAALSAAHAMSPTPSTASRSSPSARSGRSSARTRVGHQTERDARHALEALDGELGLRGHRLGRPVGVGRGPRARARLGVEERAHEVDPRDPVHEAVVGLGDDREAVVLEPVHEPRLPERLGAVEALGEDPPRERAELLDRPRRGQGGLAHVVGEVEERVVDPEGPPEAVGREGELLAVARRQVQPPANVLEQRVVGRGGAVEGEDGAHVHVGGLVLLGEEGGVERAELVAVARAHQRPRVVPRRAAAGRAPARPQ